MAALDREKGGGGEDDSARVKEDKLMADFISLASKVRILRSQLATKFTMHNDHRADF